MIRIAAITLLLSACAEPVPPPTTTDPHPFGWLSGCWQTDGGTSHEEWNIATADLLFGFNLALEDGNATFFEQMRLERTDAGWVFAAYPMGEGPSFFPATEVKTASVAFTNAAHDYPQRIVYRRDGEQLAAEISLADGSNPNQWTFTRCSTGAR